MVADSQVVSAILDGPPFCRITQYIALEIYVNPEKHLSVHNGSEIGPSVKQLLVRRVRVLFSGRSSILSKIAGKAIQLIVHIPWPLCD